MTRNRARNAPKPAYLMPNLGRKWVPRGFFNTLTSLVYPATLYAAKPHLYPDIQDMDMHPVHDTD
jgi:hypothetical protein